MSYVLKSAPKLAKRQQRDDLLGPIYNRVIGGKGMGAWEEMHVIDDNDLLWHAPKDVPKREAPRLAILRSLVPEVLALAYSTFEHPGVAKTTLVVRLNITGQRPRRT